MHGAYIIIIITNALYKYALAALPDTSFSIMLSAGRMILMAWSEAMANARMV